MQHIVGIQYTKTGKVYYFSSPSFSLKIGDKVIVDTANGKALGFVTFTDREIEDEKIEEPLKPVLRIATEKDLKLVEELKDKARKQIPLIEEKVKQLNLDMRIVSTEYTLDETKITITYTSDGRVDFRELLKLLASALKCKIELRQIGIRDEVKAIGGLGLCGQECCCTRFLNEPTHVSVKMAKLQNLSLNPTKTGGLCGRMMCCLAYEEGVYADLLKNLPPVGSVIKTPEGEGTVSYNDILKQVVTVKIPTGDNSYKLKEFKIEELNGDIKNKEAEAKVETPVNKETKQNNKNNKQKNNRR